ncbi:Uncharacterised protein [Leclercia adecarboxylata]|uniref:Uncharacterized protein n=1 Tax=Leclercia adecarboxylata TaxID=83655 RepID=A0A4U9HW77_9ENTR|nr:Uncharacterised protein [Leclercia adecarboxylata]
MKAFFRSLWFPVIQPVCGLSCGTRLADEA